MDAVEIQASGLETGVPGRLDDPPARALLAGGKQITLPLDAAFDL